MALLKHKLTPAAGSIRTCASHPDTQRQPAGALRYRIELPDDEGSAAVGRHDLDLEAVSGADSVDGTVGMSPP